MASKKIMGVLLSLAMVFSMTACSKKAEETKKKTKKTKETVEETETEDTEEEPTDDTKESEEPTQSNASGILDPDANIKSSNAASGVLNILVDSYDGFMGGTYLLSPTSGNDAMNRAGYRQYLIRSMFGNNDHIEIYLNGASDTLAAYLVPHHDNDAVYTKEYVKSLPDEIARTELKDPHDATWYWGDVCLNEETYEAGYYDLLFTDNGEPVAKIILKIVNESFLNDYSEAAYYEMVKEDLDKHNASELYKVKFDRFYGCLEQGIWPDDYTWSGSGLPTLPCENPEATITLNQDESLVNIVAKLISQDEETACEAIDNVFTQNGYEIRYPDGDSDANYRYVDVDIESVPCEICYWGYNGELNLYIRNLIADN